MNNGHTTKHRHRRVTVDTSAEVPLGNHNNALLSSPASTTSNRSPRRRVKKKSKKVLYVLVLMISISFLALMLWAVSNIPTALLGGASPNNTNQASQVSHEVPRQLKDVQPLTQSIDQMKQDWPSDVIHIVNTRFMQEQGTLRTLGMARYHQFMTFCFPSIQNQTTTDFIWVVKTDPQLAPEILELMIQTLQPYPHFYLVGSNHNFMINKNNGSWKGGEEGDDLLNSTIYTGNLTRLQQAIALRNELPILETRLDADDGLHQMYINYVQGVAIRRFEKDNDADTPDWLYWCIRRHLEWHTPLTDTTDPFLLQHGILIPIQHTNLCITPGITVGYNVHADPTKVPVYPHDALLMQLSQRDEHNKTTHSCYPPGKQETASDEETDELPCLDMAEAFLLGALRSRTWTSAGMMRVEADSEVKNPVIVQKLWKLLHNRFAVEPDRVQELMKYFEEHRQEIARENLLGQCTTGHSCKKSAKQELQKYMKK